MADFAFDTYQRYKIGTRYFISWLAESAQQCCIRSTKKSGRAKPIKSSRKRQTIRIKDLIGLAQKITGSIKPAIEVPSSIFSILSDVISLRKEYSRWFEGLPCDNRPEVPDGHQFLINVLENVREILRPRVVRMQEQKKKQVDPKRTNLTNLFETLDLEDPTSITDFEPTTSDETAKKSSFTETTYEIESPKDPKEHISLSLFCFFRDLYAIRQTIVHYWSQYREGNFTLTTVSLITDIAIGIIKRNAADLVATLPGADMDDPLCWIYTQMFRMDDLDQEVESLSLQQAEFLCLTTYSHYKNWINFTNPYHGKIMVLSKAQYETMDLDSEWSTLEFRDKWRTDEIFLQFLLTYFQTLSITDFSMDEASCAGFDNITLAFFGKLMFQKDGPLLQKKSTSPWVIFALQILLDIQHTMRRDSFRAFDELCLTADRVTATIRQYFRFSRDQSAHANGTWHKDKDAEILKITKLISKWIKQDHLIKGLDLCPENRKILEDQGNEIRPFFLLKHHPVLCGTIQYWLLRFIQKFGIIYCQSDSTCRSAAHLYNACKQSGMGMTWPDMDYLISLHTPERLFVGGLPTKPEGFYKHLLLTFGMNPTRFAPNRRKGIPGLRKHDIRSRDLRESFPIHDILDTRYYDGQPNISLTVANIDKILGDISLGVDHPMAKDAEKWTKTRHNIDYYKLISLLGESIMDQEKNLHFDYISMHQRATTMFLNIRSFFIDQASTRFNSLEDYQALVNNERSLEHFTTTSNRQIVSEDLFPKDNVLLSALITKYILMTCVPAAAYGQVVDPQEHDDIDWSAYCKSVGISLKGACEVMERTLTNEADLEVKKAEARAVPFLRKVL